MRKRLFPLLAVLLLAPWPVAYAYDNAQAGPEQLQIQAAPQSATPAWRVYGGAIGGVTSPIDLFYVDTTSSRADVRLTLYLTNTDELVEHYRYMNLRVGVYSQNGTDQWRRASQSSGGPLPDTYITLQNGSVGFNLAGNTRYKLAIDGGCFYAFQSVAKASSVSPGFYLTAE